MKKYKNKARARLMLVNLQIIIIKLFKNEFIYN